MVGAITRANVEAYFVRTDTHSDTHRPSPRPQALPLLFFSVHAEGKGGGEPGGL